ncbi:DUF6286 domain-containing protein [Microbispora sp. NPDC049125]|uniref:DUF6286 domain-containing protein n=1 Tax=Microbispora sp. NPDC049125 TaxID=3154929 RepID=UPI0034651DE3
MTAERAPSDGGGFFVPMPRAGGRGAVRAFRPTRSIPATIASLALLAVGVLTAAHVVSALLKRPMRLVPYDRATDWARTTTWDDGRAVAIATAVALAGLVLLLIAVVPGRGRLIALRTGDPDLVVGVPRRTLAGTLSAAASRVDGVRRAHARVYGWKTDVMVRTDLRDTPALTERVHEAVGEELARLAPAHPISVRVRVHGPS